MRGHESIPANGGESSPEELLRHTIESGPDAGIFVFSDSDGMPIGGSEVTFDHSKVGDVLRSGDDIGPAAVERMMREQASPEYAALLEQMDEWRSEPDKYDFF